MGGGRAGTDKSVRLEEEESVIPKGVRWIPPPLADPAGPFGYVQVDQYTLPSPRRPNRHGMPRGRF